MECRPFEDLSEGTRGEAASDQGEWSDADGGRGPSVSGMEMGWEMVVPVHGYHDAEECADA